MPAKITLEVKPKKPRLAWLGMGRKEVARPVPTQVTEIVRPNRAVDRGEQAVQIPPVQARAANILPTNRLIWTSDNLVALQTLLDEKTTFAPDGYRGKVDLVYIDPPFMVNADFHTDNSVKIDLDGDRKPKSKPQSAQVELLAYRDTWRQGLDSFLTMLRGRLELLKQLLAPTGSIYVHLDWHAVHYVKVLMDEMFGCENFRNEIVWQRTRSHNDPGKFGVIHDTLLYYAASAQAQYWGAPTLPAPPGYFAAHDFEVDEAGKRYRARDLTARSHGGDSGRFEWRGVRPPSGRMWAYPSVEKLEELLAQKRIKFTKSGFPRLKLYLDDEVTQPVQSIWAENAAVNSGAAERLGFPTQKPITLLERIISASCPPAGLVLDCFAGSGTTAEAAERLGRNWIAIDSNKYAIHLARKRLIQLDGRPQPPGKAKFRYIECATCKHINRRHKPQRSPGSFEVRPFTVETLGVYSHAGFCKDLQAEYALYCDEMIKLLGGQPTAQSPLLHGRKGDSWIHVGTLDGPISGARAWDIARAAQGTSCKTITILSVDPDTISGSERNSIQAHTSVSITVRAIPAQAIDEVRRRMKADTRSLRAAVESWAAPIFYASLSIGLAHKIADRTVSLRLTHCEVDIESFLASQQPAGKALPDGMSPAARKRGEAQQAKWQVREVELQKWLAKPHSWRSFVDFWAVDWYYSSRRAEDGRMVFQSGWQSLRMRKGESKTLVFAAQFKYPQPGHYSIAAKVTDVFGNDGIAIVPVEIG
jgi:adenine-specific DNA-methyltransferase